MDINTTFNEYVKEKTKDTNGKIYGIWGDRGEEKLYVLDTNFKLLNEVRAYKKGNYTKKALTLLDGEDPILLVLPKNISEVKSNFELDHNLFIKARRIEKHRNTPKQRLHKKS
ncbi:MAG: hypothetical protein SLAVMIC_00057 [uncultured marine phage]|uniref:Uncharacterized protein n=1 Tax=uncultured marine phage TaxID=707152 RepID=A0A8D9FQR7_9VIRU|nr:MAG: hypothetical protein SLAVMIC_00057 [uncultured marine phage]